MNRFSLLIYAGLAALCGCGTETGILLEVRAAPGLEGADIRQLEVYLGTPNGDGSFVRQTAADDLIDVSGRDLTSDPYELMLRPGPDQQGKLAVAVAARGDGALIGFGGLPHPVAFADGEVQRWEIVLEPLPADGVRPVTPTGCARWDQSSIGVPEDPDCDGFTTEEEGEACANDPWLNPDAIEVCDGLDNNCDGACDDVDADGDGVYACASECVDPERAGDCNDDDSTVHPRAEELCDGIDQNCSSGGGPAEACGVYIGDVCVQGELGCGEQLSICGPIEPTMTADNALCPAKTECILTRFVGDPESCPGTESLALLAGNATECTWTIVEVTPDTLLAKFASSGGTDDSSDVCDAVLEVETLDNASGSITLQLRTETGTTTHIVDVAVDPTDNGLCPAEREDVLICTFN